MYVALNIYFVLFTTLQSTNSVHNSDSKSETQSLGFHLDKPQLSRHPLVLCKRYRVTPCTSSPAHYLQPPPSRTATSVLPPPIAVSLAPFAITASRAVTAAPTNPSPTKEKEREKVGRLCNRTCGKEARRLGYHQPRACS